MGESESHQGSTVEAVEVLRSLDWPGLAWTGPTTIHGSELDRERSREAPGRGVDGPPLTVV